MGEMREEGRRKRSTYHDGLIGTLDIKAEPSRWGIIVVRYACEYLGISLQALTAPPYHLHGAGVETVELVIIVYTAKEEPIEPHLEREGERDGGREGGREGRREGGREGGKEGERERKGGS